MIINAQEDLIHEFGEWEITYTAAPIYEIPTMFNCEVKWEFVFNNEILN